MTAFGNSLRRLVVAGTLLAAVAAMFVGWIWTAAPGQAQASMARVLVIDGDTIVVRGRLVQLYGVDAPELGQHCLQDGVWEPCGLNAAFELSKLLAVEHGKVQCAPMADKKRGVGEVCHVDGIDIAAVLLEGGYVIAADGDERYRALQAAARRVPLGIWLSDFVKPAEWRAGRRLTGEAEAEADCPVKAVRTATGARVYYVPTDKGYTGVAVDEAAGDRLFCSDEAARADGWRWIGSSGVKP